MVFLKNKNTRIAYFAIVFAFSIFLFGHNSAYAASLHLSPSSGNITVGNILNVSILVDTQGKTINNADAVIQFPANLLEAVSVSKTGSIFSLWVEEPAFSNGAGTISLNGGIPAPGFSGSAGRVATVAFRVKAPGFASLVFNSGAVRANDGLGTDILNFSDTATFTISPAPEIPVPKPTPTPEPEPAPIIVDEPVVVEEEEVYTPPAPIESVPEESWITRIVEFVSNINLYSSLLWLIIFIVILTIILMYGRGRFVRLRSGVRKETDDVEKVLHYSFDTLKEDIVACVGLLERAKGRRRLTEEERAVVSLLKQHLRQTEQLVTKEIHDIRRNVEK
ncbi:MAG: cohesin domain-containing protein [Patescibacteria group bacterium]